MDIYLLVNLPELIAAILCLSFDKKNAISTCVTHNTFLSLFKHTAVNKKSYSHTLYMLSKLYRIKVYFISKTATEGLLPDEPALLTAKKSPQQETNQRFKTPAL
jgi:hypothetical protein